MQRRRVASDTARRQSGCNFKSSPFDRGIRAMSSRLLCGGGGGLRRLTARDTAAATRTQLICVRVTERRDSSGFRGATMRRRQSDKRRRRNLYLYGGGGGKLLSARRANEGADGSGITVAGGSSVRNGVVVARTSRRSEFYCLYSEGGAHSRHTGSFAQSRQASRATASRQMLATDQSAD